MNKILQGDSYKLLSTIPDNSVDYIIFSPPYDNLRSYDEFPPFNKDNRELLGKECLRVLKDDSICTVIIQDQTIDRRKSGTSFRLVAEWLDLGWGLFETTIYQRHGPPGIFWTKRFRVDHEYVHNFIKGEKPHYFNKEHMLVPSKNAGKMVSCDKRHKNGETEEGKDFLCPDLKCRGTVWEYNSSNREGNKIKSAHPATFPDKLCGDLIKCFSAPKDVVLDPFAGSGTSCVMAAVNGRQYLGIEFSSEYVKIIEERLKREVDSLIKWE
jgi:site-specific DNA-methyltransferase (adenine-specific)